MSSGREASQQNRGDRQGDRQANQDSRQTDRQSNQDDRREQIQNEYGDWYNDSWEPGDGWHNAWENYPVATAFGVTAWGVNRLSYGMGYEEYSNPCDSGGGSYYSEPLVSYSEEAQAAATDGTPPADAAADGTDPGMQAFNDARTAFFDGDAEKALGLLDTTLKTMPKDTVVHEFRSLVLFSLKRYPESAAAIYAVFSAGPGWNWTTMIGLYGSADTYTKQLRDLEAFAKDNPKSMDGRFLLGYHYMTAGHGPQASKQFKLAQELLPDDKLVAQLVSMTTPADATAKEEPAKPAEPPVVPEGKVLTIDKVVGLWKASNKTSQFELDLAKDGQFTWSFTAKGKAKQSVKGAFAVDQNNLAMEPDAGGTMLAEIDMISPTEFHFTMIGGSAKDPGLDFKKSK